jgi:hypothetical protein
MDKLALNRISDKMPNVLIRFDEKINLKRERLKYRLIKLARACLIVQK